jgi:hypothetical protein
VMLHRRRGNAYPPTAFYRARTGHCYKLRVAVTRNARRPDTMRAYSRYPAMGNAPLTRTMRPLCVPLAPMLGALVAAQVAAL